MARNEEKANSMLNRFLRTKYGDDSTDTRPTNTRQVETKRVRSRWFCGVDSFPPALSARLVCLTDCWWVFSGAVSPVDVCDAFFVCSLIYSPLSIAAFSPDRGAVAH